MQTITGYRDHTAKVRGLSFHYLEWGTSGAPPMVLLHGLTGHAHTWDHVASALAERYHVYAPDQRGHGDTSHAESYATADFVADLDELAAQWKLDRFVLMGLSMGGHNAMAYAAAHPDRVSRLIVIDIPPRMRREQSPNWPIISKRAETGHQPFASLEEAFSEARTGNPVAPDENLSYRTHWNLNSRPDGGLVWKYDPQAPARWEPADLTNKLAQINIPTLLVRGGKTLVLPRETADAMAAAISDCELIEVAESGHSVPTDRPEDLQRIVLDWLARRA